MVLFNNYTYNIMSHWLKVQPGEMDIFVISKLVWVTSIINGLTGATLSMGLIADWFGIYQREWDF